MTSEFNKIEDIYKSKLPFVVYRKPNENVVSVMVQNTTNLVELNSYQQKGFIFAPFNKTEKTILFSSENCDEFSFIIQNFEALQTSSTKIKTEAISTLESAKQQHISLVEKAIYFIKHKKADKIVVSRKETLKISNFEVLNSYKKMLKNYKNAMVYLWFHPKVGCWMGASPERLVNLQQNKFKTIALAGTQPYKNTTGVEWNDKEKQEQQFVTDYILKTIKNTILNIKISKPYTVKAGNLLHIKTDISGDLSAEKSFETLIKSLHPTPAVCGLPKNVATDFILQNENYHRTFYTGYLGELNLNNQTNLFVNLRCMQINNNEISIYIGGGITKDSKPEKEWNETVFKAKVMKKVL
jgi:isochorismate synthase